LKEFLTTDVLEVGRDGDAEDDEIAEPSIVGRAVGAAGEVASATLGGAAGLAQEVSLGAAEGVRSRLPSPRDAAAAAGGVVADVVGGLGRVGVQAARGGGRLAARAISEATGQAGQERVQALPGVPQAGRGLRLELRQEAYGIGQQAERQLRGERIPEDDEFGAGDPRYDVRLRGGGSE